MDFIILLSCISLVTFCWTLYHATLTHYVVKHERKLDREYIEHKQLKQLQADPDWIAAVKEVKGWEKDA